MIDTKRKFERFLQKYRFRMAIPIIQGDVMDFGGNDGELAPFVKGEYLVVNYDHSVMAGKKFDTIVALAVVEHIEYQEVFKIFKNFKENHMKPGAKIILTTPTPASKPVLEFLAHIGILQKENIEEHKHYWDKKDFDTLAEQIGFKIEKYKKFQLGMNQFVILS